MMSIIIMEDCSSLLDCCSSWPSTWHVTRGDRDSGGQPLNNKGRRPDQRRRDERQQSAVAKLRVNRAGPRRKWGQSFKLNLIRPVKSIGRARLWR